MPLLALLFAASLALIFAASVLFNTPPQTSAKPAPRNMTKTTLDSGMRYRKTVGL